MFETYGAPEDPMAITTSELSVIKADKPEFTDKLTAKNLKIPSLLLRAETEQVFMSNEQLIVNLMHSHMNGNLVYIASGPSISEYIDFDAYDATIYQTYFPYVGMPALSLNGLRMVGAFKRLRFLKKQEFVACEPADLEHGDRAVFETSKGELATSSKIMHLLDKTE